MKFEKLSENKIRIILTQNDLTQKNVNAHSFMANAIESQDLFLFALERAEKELGFSTKNCKVKIEALAMNTGDFVLTVTKVLPSTEKSSILQPPNNSLPTLHPYRKNLHIARKKININTSNCVYKFNCFNDFCDFANIYSAQVPKSNQLIAKEIVLYSYNNLYYLTFININQNYKYLKRLLILLVEFSSSVNNPNSFIYKLQEYGDVTFKHNVLNTVQKHFTQ
ncbi:MAG: adaptor protein MecA [Clostridia bacterium]|nr:adaptor protein MecA [Clostridia bacterium]